ncbi:MAG: polysaccharide biosynthesis tyrosine autokinase [Planctomycetales bacterium]|nr:polysaccharide biosynthesis tyrosine autokinase [Planctomycetales bacterium]
MNQPGFQRQLPSQRMSPAGHRRSANSTNHADFSPRIFYAVIARWWKILVPATLLLLALSSAAVMMTFEPKYRAFAQLRINESQPFVAFETASSTDRKSVEKFVQTQIELLRSQPVLEMVLSRPEIANISELARRQDPMRWLQTEGLIITPVNESELLSVSYAGPSPDKSADVVNAVIDAYFSMRKDKQDEQTRQIVQMLESERQRRAREITIIQGEIRDLQKQLVSKDPTLVATAIGPDVIVSENPLKNIQENLARSQVEKQILEAQVSAMENSLSEQADVPSVLVERAVAESEEVQRLNNDIAEKRTMMGQILTASAYGEKDPKYEKLARDVQRLETTLQMLRNQARPRIQEEMQAFAGLERQKELRDLKTQLETQNLIVQSMVRTYEAKVKEASLSGAQTMDLRFKQEELLREQEVFNVISQRTMELRTEMNAPNRVSVWHTATIPVEPEEKIPVKLLLLAVAGSLTVPFGLCVLWERSIRRVSSVEELQTDSLLPVVGEIARLPSHVGGNSVRYELGLFEESIDSLRTGLILAHNPEEIQVLAVVSAVSGEGKSSVSSQLAVSLARSTGQPTLLIDGDMRSPDAHRIFQLELEPGLSNVLEGTCSVAEAINKSWSDHVHVMPAGILKRSPHKLLGTGEFKRVLDEVRTMYRYIVIDTPPVLAASESLVMARDSDGTLICVMRDVSRQSHIKMTYERLLTSGAKPIGTVLNGVPVRQYARKYGTYDYVK